MGKIVGRLIRKRVAVSSSQKNHQTFSVNEALGLIMNPFLELTSFNDTTIPLQGEAYAGCAVATYLFEDTQTGILNWSSEKDKQVTYLGPGDLHWAEAGTGCIQEYIPIQELPSHGLQVMINLAAQDKLNQPESYYVKALQIPEIYPDSFARIRILAGRAFGLTAHVHTLTTATLLDVYLKPGGKFFHKVSRLHTAFIYVIAGKGFAPLDEIFLFENELIEYDKNADSICITATQEGVHFIYASGEVLEEPVVMEGNVVMNTKEQLDLVRCKINIAASRKAKSELSKMY
jgi:hypothetical protein